MAFFSANAYAAKSPDVTVKIANVEKALGLVDQVAADFGTPPGQSPTAMIRGMLQGTDWIDPNRPLVIGITFDQPVPSAGIFIPFARANEGFKAAYNAFAGPNYYAFTFPPGQAGPIDEEFAEGLAQSASAPVSMFSVQAKVRSLIEANADKINQMLQQMQSAPMSQQQPMAPSPQEIQAMMEKMVDMGKQVETADLGFDLDAVNFTYLFSIQSVPGTEMASLATRGPKTTRLAGFQSDLPMSFRYYPYDYKKFMDILDQAFGDIYRKMGIDFNSLSKMVSQFDGDMAGGFSFDAANNAFVFEVVAATSPGISDTFLESEYIPWMVDYGKSMAETMAKAMGVPIQPLFQKAPDSQVAGLTVKGVTGQFPIMPMDPGGSGQQMLEFTMRMAQKGDKFLMASDDGRLEKLAAQADTFSQAAAEGPLMQMVMDLNQYMKIYEAAMPGLFGANPPRMGKMTFTANAENGNMVGEMIMARKDLAGFMELGKAMSQAQTRMQRPMPDGETSTEQETEQEAVETEEQTPAAMEPEEKKDQAPAKPKAKDSRYWFDKASLASVYGNEKSAVRYYKKAVEIDPENAPAYFQMGVSLGEIGDFEAAVTAINQAISLRPDKGLYPYGLGRVLLLSGDTEAALEAFKKAAALGDEDAIEYLKNQ